MIQIRILSGLETLYDKTFEGKISEEETKFLGENYLEREVLSQTVYFIEGTRVSNIDLNDTLNARASCLTLILKPEPTTDSDETNI